MSDVEGVRNLIGTGLVEFFGGLLTAVMAFIFLLHRSAEDDADRVFGGRRLCFRAAVRVQNHSSDLPRAGQRSPAK